MALPRRYSPPQHEGTPPKNVLTQHPSLSWKRFVSRWPDHQHRRIEMKSHCWDFVDCWYGCVGMTYVLLHLLRRLIQSDFPFSLFHYAIWFCTFPKWMEIQLENNSAHNVWLGVHQSVFFCLFFLITSNQQEQLGGSRSSELPLCLTPKRPDADEEIYIHTALCFGLGNRWSRQRWQTESVFSLYYSSVVATQEQLACWKTWCMQHCGFMKKL